MKVTKRTKGLKKAMKMREGAKEAIKEEEVKVAAMKIWRE